VTSVAFAVIALIGFVFVLGAVGFVVATIVLTRRRLEPPVRTVLSPDGNYWWDGSRWRPVPRP
jgi:hypothetical protein